MSIMRMNQDATYWYPDGPPIWGETPWSSPVHLKVRWEDRQTVIKNKEGKEVVSNAVVYAGTNISKQGRLQIGIQTGAPTEQAREPEAVSQHVTLSGDTDHWKVYL